MSLHSSRNTVQESVMQVSERIAASPDEMASG
jgi:hypothetical protein